MPPGPRRCSCGTSSFDYIVGPSGSCVHHVRDNFTAIPQTATVTQVRARTYELVEFLHDILKVDAFPWARFPHRVGLHNSCGTLRRLGHARAVRAARAVLLQAHGPALESRGNRVRHAGPPGRMLRLRRHLLGVREVVSAKMGYDKVSDHAQAGAEYIVSADSSCLMHQQGCAERIGVPMKFIHIAEILNGASA